MSAKGKAQAPGIKWHESRGLVEVTDRIGNRIILTLEEMELLCDEWMSILLAERLVEAKSRRD